MRADLHLESKCEQYSYGGSHDMGFSSFSAKSEFSLPSRQIYPNTLMVIHMDLLGDVKECDYIALLACFHACVVELSGFNQYRPRGFTIKVTRHPPHFYKYSIFGD